jgi:hypothetical protein
LESSHFTFAIFSATKQSIKGDIAQELFYFIYGVFTTYLELTENQQSFAYYGHLSYYLLSFLSSFSSRSTEKNSSKTFFFLAKQRNRQPDHSKKKAQKTSQDQSFLLNLSKLKLSLIPSTIKEPRPEKNKRRFHTNVKQGQTQNMSYLKLIKPNKNTGCKTPQTAQKKTIKTH